MKEKGLLAQLTAKTQSGKILWHWEKDIRCFRFFIHGIILYMQDDDGTMAIHTEDYGDIGFVVNSETLKEDRERLRESIREQDSVRTDRLAKLIAFLDEL